VLYRASRRAIVVEAASRKEGKGRDHHRWLSVCLPAVLSVKPRNSSHLQCRDGLGAQKVPHRRCVSFSHACLSTYTHTRRGGGRCRCQTAQAGVRASCPASLSASGMARACPTRERHGARRGRGTRDSDVSSANLVSQWMEGPVVGRGREPQSEWVGGQGSIPNH
jgi:hypothetical protein